MNSNYYDGIGKKGHIFMMGRRYTKNQEPAPDNYEAFRRDERSRLLFTYRKGFPSIGNTSITSDKGWGCLLRTSQMMLGEVLSRLFLGRDFRPEDSLDIEKERERWIIQHFLDAPTRPFSLHRISMRGEKYGKKIGQWFGPTDAAFVLRDIIRSYSSRYIPLRAVVMQDGLVNARAVERIASIPWSLSLPPNPQITDQFTYQFDELGPLPICGIQDMATIPYADKIFMEVDTERYQQLELEKDAKKKLQMKSRIGGGELIINWKKTYKSNNKSPILIQQSSFQTQNEEIVTFEQLKYTHHQSKKQTIANEILQQQQIIVLRCT
ncbi:MAG: putative Autophagy-specific protein [Streblomastix strix]|uniref:Cysteine protease n=1 Tax=Streblomastix strix TaxID=222440 RepID=A0A5J4W8K9_9EUKA|nr:MAG: putative Autophagy-specific protein [Streblomastix strix]